MRKVYKKIKEKLLEWVLSAQRIGYFYIARRQFKQYTILDIFKKAAYLCTSNQTAYIDIVLLDYDGPVTYKDFMNDDFKDTYEIDCYNHTPEAFSMTQGLLTGLYAVCGLTSYPKLELNGEKATCYLQPLKGFEQSVPYLTIYVPKSAQRHDLKTLMALYDLDFDEKGICRLFEIYTRGA